MEEKIKYEFDKDWSIDYTKEKLEKYEIAISLIKDLTEADGNIEDILEEIKGIIKELNYEING